MNNHLTSSYLIQETLPPVREVVKSSRERDFATCRLEGHRKAERAEGGRSTPADRVFSLVAPDACVLVPPRRLLEPRRESATPSFVVFSSLQTSSRPATPQKKGKRRDQNQETPPCRSSNSCTQSSRRSVFSTVCAICALIARSQKCKIKVAVVLPFLLPIYPNSFVHALSQEKKHSAPCQNPLDGKAQR